VVESGGLVRGFVVQPHQLSGLECGHGVGSAVVVAELDFEDPRRPALNNGADLARTNPSSGRSWSRATTESISMSAMLARAPLLFPLDPFMEERLQVRLVRQSLVGRQPPQFRQIGFWHTYGHHPGA